MMRRFLALLAALFCLSPSPASAELQQAPILNYALSMLEEVRYDSFFSFIYSIRRGTPAERMEQVPENVKTQRFARLLDVQNRISREKNEAYVGQVGVCWWRA